MRNFSRSVKCGQRQPYMIALRVDGTGTASILEGSNEVTLTDNGTGDYTLTFSEPFSRVPSVVATPVTADIYCQIATVAVSSVNIKTFNVSAQAATDADFHVMVMGFDAADAV